MAGAASQAGDADLQASKKNTRYEKFFRSYSELLPKFGEILFQEYASEEISHPVFYGDLVYKLRRVKCAANIVSSGLKVMTK